MGRVRTYFYEVEYVNRDGMRLKEIVSRDQPMKLPDWAQETKEFKASHKDCVYVLGFDHKTKSQLRRKK